MTGRRRALLWAGMGLLVVGLVIVAYIGWQLFGTTIISKHRQAETVERLEREWRAPSKPATEPQPGEAFAIVRVPRFGDEYAVPVIHGIDDDDLSLGFGHFPESSMPGDEGNFAIAGHRITHGQPLRDMPSLQPGDEVLVETVDAVHTYVLDTDPDDLEVDKDAGWVVDARPVNPDPDGVQPADEPRLITLVTCTELFHTDDRTVVFGHLVETTPK